MPPLGVLGPLASALEDPKPLLGLEHCSKTQPQQENCEQLCFPLCGFLELL